MTSEHFLVVDLEATCSNNGIVPRHEMEIIEIGAVEVVNRKLTGRHFHKYLNPERDVDDGAFEVHGLSRAFLSDKPGFHEVVEELLAFIEGAELVIHNAPFDLSFLDYELKLLAKREPTLALPRAIGRVCSVTDSLAVARHKHPGQKNNLDALCRRYEVDNSQRTLHGALLDAEILADVYLLMTGGQTQLFAADGDRREAGSGQIEAQNSAPVRDAGVSLAVVSASVEELAAHEAFLDMLDAQAEGNSIWRGGLSA